MNIEAMISRHALKAEQARILADALSELPIERFPDVEFNLTEPRDRDIRWLAVQFIAERDGWNCYLCGDPLDRSSAIVEHIIPVSRSGPNHPSNVALSCVRCNEVKAHRYVSLNADRNPVYHQS